MSEILTSVHRPHIGVDKDGYVTGKTGLAFPELKLGPSGSEVSVAGPNALNTASTASNIPAGGHTSLAATTAAAYTMNGPVTGVPKTLHATSTSTGQTVTLASGTFSSTAGSSQNRATFTGIGQSLTLMALSTSLFAVLGNQGGVTYSTA